MLQANADQANADSDTIGDACERIAVLRIGTPAGRHVKARLRNVADQPIAGARIVFRARDGRAMCSDRTGPDGWAGCDSAIALPAGGYRAIFAGDANYDPASDRTGP